MRRAGDAQPDRELGGAEDLSVRAAQHADDVGNAQVRSGFGQRHGSVSSGKRGGGLAAALALVARGRGGPALTPQILDAPTVDDRLETPSMRDLHDTPL
jgi:hypothetical protein